MRTILPTILCALCLPFSGAAQAYELVEVLSGDTLLVKEDQRRVRLELAGIWVPAPPAQGVKGQYRGAEARAFVEDILLTAPAYIKEVEPRRRGADSRKVRIRVGEEGEHDLAVLLADAGLGLAVRGDTRDPEHADSIYQAERTARRELRGMHDGGLRDFERRASTTELDLGVGVLSAHRASGRRRSVLAYLETRSPSIRAPETTPEFGIHRTGSDAIRDWGSRMGLPPDHSSSGY